MVATRNFANYRYAASVTTWREVAKPPNDLSVVLNAVVCTRLRELQEALSAVTIALEISSRNARVQALQKRWDYLRASLELILDQRGAATADIPGDAKDLLCRDYKGRRPIGWYSASTRARSRRSPNSVAEFPHIKCCGLLTGPRAAGTLSVGTIAHEISSHNSRVQSCKNRGTACAPAWT
jgi:hypothetical protein